MFNMFLQYIADSIKTTKIDFLKLAVKNLKKVWKKDVKVL